MRLLLVEDSEPLVQALQRYLQQAGYVCDVAADGVAANDFLNTYDYDAVILDLMLPRRDGFEVLGEYRQRQGAAPVLVLSARDQVQDRVQALDAGADDYLVKPFSLEELLARVRALMRRPAQPLAPVLRCGALEVDARSRSARWGGQDLGLTPKEYGLLEYLLRQRGRVLSRARIFEHLYDSSSDASDKVVEVIVSTLRTKLSRFGGDELIQTRRGFGYVLP
ncbi:two-component system response regulator [Pseudoxanthomonas kalamensis DSM 18571]|uniref:response regulator transcription factor n=1 Tax=Pseudoxanthomonas kalamensis TaxID=289483 RepID=UPI001390EC67|nr:response regulator transcription factor [Pseudoxanthomonas kalamensis]KAF1712667.1 two-component system response regulator [Pseudoxanthomonas kalamensis DSM 18571]